MNFFHYLHAIIAQVVNVHRLSDTSFVLAIIRLVQFEHIPVESALNPLLECVRIHQLVVKSVTCLWSIEV